MRTTAYFSVYFLCLFTFSFISLSYQATEADLVTKLTSTSKFVRPVKDPKNTINVTFGFELVHLVKISESEQTIQVKLWLRMYWKNEVLLWDPYMYDGATDVRLDYDTVWTPDIFLEQDVGEEISSGPEKYKTSVICTHDGSQSWLVPVFVTTSCLYDVTNFPYDRQQCFLKFLSWTYDQVKLDLILDTKPISTSNYIKSPEWILINSTGMRQSKKYNCCPNPYVELIYTITIERRAMYYIFNAIIPCVIQMLIILFTFFLPPDCGERIGVVITVLLVFAVYLEVISGNLPKSSGSVPALSLFYIVSMATSSCSLISTCIVLVIHFKGAEKGVQPMAKWVSVMFIDRIGWYIGVRKNLREHSNEELLALEKEEKKKETSKASSANGKGDGKGNVAHIIDEVRVITQLIQDQNLQDEVEEEWQTLGKVFDRIFFIIFVIIFLLQSVIILVPVYLQHKNLYRDEKM